MDKISIILVLFYISYGKAINKHLIQNIQLSSGVDARIWNGRNANAGQFPYQALLQMSTEDDRIGTCGGSLITTSYVLTAAHCCDGFSYTTVFLGLINKTEMNEPFIQKFVVKNSSYIIHEDYDPEIISNDICLLKLPTEAVINNNVSTVTLPEKNDKTPTKYDSRPATVSGWGQVIDDGEVYPILQWSTVTIKPHWLCKFVYLFINKVDDNEICSSKIPYTGPCRGDSGGPLTVKDSQSGKQVEIGLVSWGAGECSSVYFPLVYTYVPYFIDWINTHISNSTA